MKRLIFLLFMAQKLLAQNNMIPNPGFENTGSGWVTSTSNSNDLNSYLDNWYVNIPYCGALMNCWERPHTSWENLDNDAGSTKYVWDLSYNCGLFDQRKFVTITTSVRDDNCNHMAKDNIRVNLPGQASFTPNTWYKIRYKMVPVGSAYGPGTSVPSGCAWTETYNQLRIYAMDLFNVEELTSAEWSGGNAANCSWRMIEREFLVTGTTMKTLTFEAHTGGFALDDVEVFLKCENNYLIQNKYYNSTNAPVYGQNNVEGNNFKEMAGTALTAGNNIGGTGGTGDVTIGYNSYVIYTAANTITLKSGFKAVNGSRFHAVNAPCPNSISSKKEEDHIPNKIGTIKDFFPQDETQSATMDIDGSIKPSVYPNPNNGSFEVGLESDQEKSIRVYDLLGTLVFEKLNTTERKTGIDITSQAKGVYFVHILYGNTLKVEKVINK
jgi:hypothetical protein